MYFVLGVHLCALVYKPADNLKMDMHWTTTSSCYRAVAAAWASGWEGPSLSLQTAGYPLVPCRLIADHICHWSIKYPQGEGWQVQGWPGEAQPGRGKDPWTQTPHHLSGSQWGPALPTCLQNQPLSHPSRCKTCLSWLLFRLTPPFSLYM